MMNRSGQEQRNTVQFGKRHIAPRACVVDVKPHIRTFLADALEELGFVARPCGRLPEVATSLADFNPDLIVLGQLAPESEVTKTLHLLLASRFKGRVMLFGGRAQSSLLALHELAEQIGLAMLPPLATPYRDSDLRENLSPFLPIPESPSLVVDVEEAMRNGWLEMWYQPKINLHEMLPCGAEALIRLRHPTWGIVPPAAFIPQLGDPHLRELSQFVVSQITKDWAYFSKGRPPLDMTIHLPAVLLEDRAFVDWMCLQLPEHIAFARLYIEIASVDVRRDHALVRAAARRLVDFNVGISVGDVMAESSWVDVADFPIAELQVNGEFINGCADDRAKRMACEMAVDIAKRLKARTLAKNLERTADCRAVCQMGFDGGQGFLFAKPMEAHRFTRTMLRRQSAVPD